MPRRPHARPGALAEIYGEMNCPTCGGSGTVFLDRETLSGLAECEKCDGTGRVPFREDRH